MKDGLIVARPEYGASVDDVFTEDEVIAHVRKTYYPDEIFPQAELAFWAERNGFVKETEE